MKAVRKLKREFGAELVEIDKPAIKQNEVLIKVNATSICGTDVHIYKWDTWSQNRIKNVPQTLGHEVTGEVVETGSSVTKVKKGDIISAETHIPCRKCINCLTGKEHICLNCEILGVDRDGVFAEYAAIPESVAWVNDPAIAPELASVQEPLGNATYALLGEDNDVYGKSVTILGDGPIALFAIAIAKLAGASKVFHIGVFEFNMNIGKQMGADYSLYANDNSLDRVKFVKEHTDGNGSDIVVEMAGAEQAVIEGLRIVRKGGRYSAFGVLPTPSISLNYNDFLVFSGIQVHGISGRKMFDTWIRVRSMLSTGRLDIRPVITHMFALDDFKAGFDAMMKTPRESAKIVLFPERKLLEERKKYLKA